MTQRTAIILAAIAMFAAASQAAWVTRGGHPYHETFAEVEYNAEARTLEAAIRFDPIALEHALSISAGSRVTEAHDEFEQFLAAYIDERLVARAFGGDLAELVMVGVEHDDRDTWVFVEFVFEDPADQILITNLLFAEINPYQINTVRYRSGPFKQTVLMSAEDTVMVVPGARLEL